MYGNDPMTRKRLREIVKTTRGILGKTRGPLVEIAGPSNKGYAPIGTKKLPNGLIIINLETENGVDVQCDVRNLPFANKSIGGVLMTALTRMPEELAKQPIPEKHRFSPPNHWPHIAKDIENNFKLILGEDLDDPSMSDYTQWSNPEIFDYSLRLAMLRESRRIIEPNGLLIANTLLATEIQIAEQLGFSLVATTASTLEDRRLEGVNGVTVMQLSNPETPAGLIAIQPLQK